MKFNLKIIGVLAAVMSLALLMTACGSGTIEIPLLDGSSVEVSTKGLSDEQVQALEEVSKGEKIMNMLVQSGLFTRGELEDMGIPLEAGAPGGNPGGRFVNDFSDIKIEDLNLEGLTDVQIEAIKQVLAGEKVLQTLIKDGILTQEQLWASGLINSSTGLRPGSGGRGQSPGSQDDGDGN